MHELSRKEHGTTRNYGTPKLHKDLVIDRLKEKGCRITKQRMTLLDIILNGDYSSCKEIYFAASRADKTIGVATVYRMVQTLEEIGALDRKNQYKMSFQKENETEGYTILLNNNKMLYLQQEEMEQVLQAGLSACGYLGDEMVEWAVFGNQFSIRSNTILN